WAPGTTAGDPAPQAAPTRPGNGVSTRCVRVAASCSRGLPDRWVCRSRGWRTQRLPAVGVLAGFADHVHPSHQGQTGDLDGRGVRWGSIDSVAVVTLECAHQPNSGDLHDDVVRHGDVDPTQQRDRKSTRLNSSHVSISYAVFCL